MFIELIFDIPPHRSYLNSFASDGGVWLRCTCGWSECMGRTPSMDVISAVWLEHTGYQLTINTGEYAKKETT